MSWNSDPDPIPCLADASFRDVVHPELTRDLLGLDGLALVDEHGIAGDHEQLAEARQFGDDILEASRRTPALGSPLMLSNGKTAIEGLLALAAGACEGSEAACPASEAGASINTL